MYNSVSITCIFHIVFFFPSGNGFGMALVAVLLLYACCSFLVKNERNAMSQLSYEALEQKRRRRRIRKRNYHTHLVDGAVRGKIAFACPRSEGHGNGNVVRPCTLHTAPQKKQGKKKETTRGRNWNLSSQCTTNKDIRSVSSDQCRRSECS